MTKLGTDIALPEIAKASATLNSTNAGLKANNSSATAIAAPGKCLNVDSFALKMANVEIIAASTLPLKARGNVSGFGLASKASIESEKPPTKRGLDFGEEESSRKKLEKLPTPPLEDQHLESDTAMANGVKEEEDGDDDEDVDMQDAGTEEETAAAARAAAEKREERLQTQNQAYQAGEDVGAPKAENAEANGDTSMSEVSHGQNAENAMEEE